MIFLMILHKKTLHRSLITIILPETMLTKILAENNSKNKGSVSVGGGGWSGWWCPVVFTWAASES